MVVVLRPSTYLFCRCCGTNTSRGRVDVVVVVVSDCRVLEER
jgi:hypothetical protein